MTKRSYTPLFLGLMLFTACQSSSKPKPPPPTVITSTIEQRNVPIYVDAIGQVISPVTVNVRPQVNGKLIGAYVQQGDIVEAGDVLYAIDPRHYQAVLDEAKAQLAQDQAFLSYAESAVKRYKSIVDEEFIAVLTYEQYEANALAAKAKVEQDEAAVWDAQINLDFCNIVAPVAGKISYFAVDVGNVMIIDDPTAITVIRPLSPIDVEFSLPQQYFEMIRQVQGNQGLWPFEAFLPETPDDVFSGTTYFIDNQLNQNTGTILLKGRFDNELRRLWPGQFVKVKVLYKNVPNAFVVPPGAILMGREGPYLYTVDADGRVETHNVNVLMRSNEYIAFESQDLQAGDVVVVDGQINIAPGMAVNITAEKK